MSATLASGDPAIAGLLARGGLDLEARDRAPSYNPLADPAGAETLARSLADRLRDAGPTVVLVWERPEDAVLGHVVARELGLPAVRAFDAEGLVGHGPGLADGARIALVADAVRDAQAVHAAHGLADQLGGELVATAVLVATQALDELGPLAGRAICLARPSEEDG